ncbi:DNA internalization-related competence protein ComEC/Rec2 [[Ruminococcus] torques]|uniref:DNA internalization-related competence protein ComEC/Rec2 n=1 Tax=[Ruminococcus] torques TaxID=33039 RepID=UPI0025A47DA8|nr:DNA internalization-related competence protein ComEC/Rec2 [[Ruminococcus] torques]MDM8237253.1 DNA internalization-related competence protein ComEC/Rec2 [[Ruminococcus] torques]
MVCVLFVAVQAIRVWLFGAGAEASALEKTLLDSLAPSGITLEGTVVKIEEKSKVTAVYAEDNAVSVSSQKIQEPMIMVYVRPEQTDKSKERIHIGNRIRVCGEAAVFDGARNPGNFDQRSYYARQGIHVLVWADKLDVISQDTDRTAQFLSEVRSAWKEILTKHLGDYYGGTMSAVLLGDKTGLDPEMKKMYQKNGIGHLLAISGLHMSFIGMGIYGLFRRIGLGFIPAGIAGGAVLVLYTLMIGAGVSSLRALIMFLIRVGADITGRDYDLATSLAVAAAILCVRQPLYVTDAGFILSFGAILGMVLLSPVFGEMLWSEKLEAAAGRKKGGRTGWAKGKGGRHMVRRYLCGKMFAAGHWLFSGLASSLAVNVLLLGPVLYFYFEIPPYSVMLNLLVIPVMPVAMASGIIGSALTLLSDSLGGAVLQASKAVLWMYDCLCGAAGALPGSRFVTGKPDIAWLAGYYAVLGILCGIFYYLRQKTEEGRSGGVFRIPGILLVVCAVGMSAACRLGCKSEDGIRAAVLDVGQGDCIYIRGEQGDYLVDGGSSDVSSAGIYRIEPYLLANAVDTLDYVFATHGDEDHINGIRELLENQDLGVRIRNLVLPSEEYLDEKLLQLAETARGNGTRTAVMRSGDTITEENGKTELKCLGPAEGTKLEPGNEASLVLELTYGDFCMLLTGDVEGQGEESLYKEGKLPQCDVLKAAHHGSHDSTTAEFLKAVQPKAALISAGVDNRYGHPHEETLERLKEAGCSVYSTQENGTLTVRTDGQKVKLSGYVREKS